MCDVHEVALSAQLAEVVRRHAAGRRVLRVGLSVGALRQVVPETLEYAWGFTIAGTDLDGAVLAVRWIPATLACDEGHRTELDGGVVDFSRPCPRCGGATRIVAGEEFRVDDIDVASEPSPAR